ncbi:MAG: HD domain-containing protein [Spirochaeta sp.]|jgi:HD-GYP domain-containing protein (c-di-GMP phosphodiesterase class II)|nr:HD domain-containing protein [Spirochaeta sp.]
MTVKIEREVLESLLTMASFVEARDAYTGGHAWRVSQYGKLLAEEMGLAKDDVFVVRLGGLVHDLGKVGVSDTVLNKKGALTNDEFALMHQHPEAGVAALGDHPLAAIVREAILEHHERYDGEGYPTRRPGASLTVIGRILGVADAFDAMTSTRAYRAGMTGDRAIAIVTEEAGRQFDPAAAEAMASLFRDGALSHVLGHAGEEHLMLNCPVCGPMIAPSEDAHDGDTTVCPSCRGRFALHRHGETFDLELQEVTTTLYMPQPDRRAVRSVLSALPSRRLKVREAVDRS